jgi:hypothetical protein
MQLQACSYGVINLLVVVFLLAGPVFLRIGHVCYMRDAPLQREYCFGWRN